MFLAPLIGMVPPEATAPALIIVGWLMISVLTEFEEEAEGAAPAEGRRESRILSAINFHEVGVGFAAALTIMLMPFTFSITDGIAAGFIFYVLIRIFQRRAAEVHPLMYVAASAFLIYFLLPILQQELSWI
jgi:AGZA family xanthine/uracil permease-like MFS transporter